MGRGRTPSRVADTRGDSKTSPTSRSPTSSSARAVSPFTGSSTSVPTPRTTHRVHPVPGGRCWRRTAANSARSATSTCAMPSTPLAPGGGHVSRRAGCATPSTSCCSLLPIRRVWRSTGTRSTTPRKCIRPSSTTPTRNAGCSPISSRTWQRRGARRRRGSTIASCSMPSADREPIGSRSGQPASPARPIPALSPSPAASSAAGHRSPSHR